MKEICALALCLLVTLCSATSPPFPSITPLDCNATQVQIGLATDLINEDRDEGFVFKPVRIESVFQQESGKVKGGFVYYIDFDVVETECSVLSGKNWKECNKNILFHEQVFGHCKAIIFIAKPWRILQLLNYNCTLSTVPSRTVYELCPDCPTVVSEVTNNITGTAHYLVEKFNKESNETRYYKTDEIERVRLQWVVGASYFFQITIKETECLKTQADVNIAECNFLKDNEAHVGFCNGESYTIGENTSFYVNCEIYEPQVIMLSNTTDDDKHEHCGSGQDSSKLEKEEKNENADPKGPGEEGPDHHRHRHGRKHHRCHPDHHHQHHEHPHRHHHREHPHHRHHHNHHLNDTHHHHGKSHDHHNHTHEHGSSSEENNENKPHEKRSKGSVQIYFNAEDPKNLPTPTIFRLPPQPGHKRKHKYDSINFPSEHSPLATCPGEPLVDLPIEVKDILFAKLSKQK